MGTLTFALAASASMLASPLEDAMKAHGQILCFTRSYDSAWLKAYSRQKLREARLALTRSQINEAAAVRIELKGDFAPYYAFGECSWYEEGLNRGVQDNVLDPSFQPTSGVGCHLYTDVTAASAEEGGDFPAAWIDGGRVLQMHLPDSFGAWRSHDASRNASYQELGAQDRIIRLERAEASACKTLIDRFAPDLVD
jgi:hypothetical protein